MGEVILALLLGWAAYCTLWPMARLAKKSLWDE